MEHKHLELELALMKKDLEIIKKDVELIRKYIETIPETYATKRELRELKNNINQSTSRSWDLFKAVLPYTIQAVGFLFIFWVMRGGG